MKIVLDENIVYADEFFSSFDGKQVTLIKKPGRDICHADLIDADALLVRSVTKVNAELLEGTAVRFVGTATIGTDHIDLSYLQQNKIRFADAGGCSADTVAQYVISAVHQLRPHYFSHQEDTVITIGVIGYGNIGKALTAIALQLGWRVLVADPFLTQNDMVDTVILVDLSTLLTHSQLVSIHVPLTTAKQSTHPTFHLLNKKALSLMAKDCLLINSARGKVVCEKDLLEDINTTNRDVVLDVFEHEPALSTELLNSLALSTPHIAGYSLEGKARGTQFIYDAFCEWQGLDAEVRFENFLPDETQIFSAPEVSVLDLTKQITTIYQITADDNALRDMYAEGAQPLSAIEQKQYFDQLRKDYALRREWQAYGLQTIFQP